MAPNLCTSVQSVGVFVGGYGILPYPRRPLKSSHRIHGTHRNDCRKYSPTEFTEFTEFTETTGEEYPPTDFTDAHRWLGCLGFSHGIHGIHRLGGYGIPAIPTLPNSVYSVNSVGEQRTITICVNPCHPWESFLCKKVLCVPCIPWEE